MILKNILNDWNKKEDFYEINEKGPRLFPRAFSSQVL
jgi:hypothetical protein